MFMGQVLQAGAGQITARQAAVNAGIPMTVPATTVNKVCLSGLNTIYLADQMIQAGEADIVVAGGMESMTNAPYLLPGARAGYRLGDQTVVDSMMYDGLFCAFDQVRHGRRHREVRGIGRPRPRAAGRARRQVPRAGRQGAEGRPVRQRDRHGRGAPAQGRPDRRSPRTRACAASTTAESLGALRPAFDKAGNITAGNASQISDGGAAVIVASKAKAEELGDRRRSARSSRLRPGRRPRPVAAHPAVPGHQAGRSSKAGVPVSDIDLFELNEAFAAVGVASMADLGITDEITNVNGGAIALGHPVGMSGTRVALTLLLELARRGGGLGAAALCGGGGQGDAILLQTIA